MTPLVLTIIGFSFLVYIYGGYSWLVQKLTRGILPDSISPDTDWPDITVLITVHNEEKVIAERIANLLATDYPANKLQIVIASDGSTDATENIVQDISARDARVRLFVPQGRKGKTDTQNRAIKQIGSEVIVFSDAKSKFEPDTLRHLVTPFRMPDVGFTTGRLVFLSTNQTALAESQQKYWQQEMAIRNAESRLGILAVGTGAVMAIRRCYFEPMPAHIGEDCILPLMAVQAGARAIHVSQAQATDYLDDEPKRALRARIRMTVRNWQGTWAYPALLNPFRNPGYAFSLWSHKLIRWLSPCFLAVWLLGSIWLVLGSAYWPVGIPGIIFLFAALLALVKIPFPGQKAVQSFLLANLGFCIGVLLAISGKKITTYNNS